MPDINKITEVLYNGLYPYHVHYDNLPLKNILQRIDLVNHQVDINSDILRGAGGSVGSLSNRLSVSLHDNGKIISSSVDNSLHNIGHHKDGSYGGISYVRMKEEERDKLSRIQSEANKLYLEIEDKIDSGNLLSSPNYYTVDTGKLKFKSSDTVFFNYEAPTTVEVGQNIAGVIKAHCVFPANAVHRHFYGTIPEHNIASGNVTPDYRNFVTTSYSSLAYFSEDSLRVYVNGVRLNTIETVNVPSSNSNILVEGSNLNIVSNITVGSNIAVGSNLTVVSNVAIGSNFNIGWKRLKIESQNNMNGTFSLNIPLDPGWRNITIDYDQMIIPS